MRFIAVGGFNTLLTAALVVALSFVMPGPLAFTISFALGIAIAVSLNGSWVFRSRVSAGRAASMALVYLAAYLIGLGLVGLFYAWHAHPVFNGATVLVTAPFSYLGGRLIYRQESKNRTT